MLTKKQLIREVARLRERISELETRVRNCNRLESSLRESEERFRFMAKTTGDVLYRLNYRSMKYDYISPSILELTGYTPEEIDETGFSSLVIQVECFGGENLSIAEIARNRQEGKTGQYLADYLIRTKSGTDRWLGDHSFPWMDASGNLIGSVGILSDITERKLAEAALRRMNRELQLLATLDGLTGMANRRRFDEFIGCEWGRMRREHAPLSLILCDIDYFKLYNDTFGHLAGDDCLKLVARTIRNCVKRPTDLVARYGGEEFAVVLSNTDTAGAITIAESIRSRVAALALPHPQPSGARNLTISCGVCTMIPDGCNSFNALIELADKGLYEAKSRGRNRIIQNAAGS